MNMSAKEIEETLAMKVGGDLMPIIRGFYGISPVWQKSLDRILLQIKYLGKMHMGVDQFHLHNGPSSPYDFW